MSTNASTTFFSLTPYLLYAIYHVIRCAPHNHGNNNPLFKQQNGKNNIYAVLNNNQILLPLESLRFPAGDGRYQRPHKKPQHFNKKIRKHGEIFPAKQWAHSPGQHRNNLFI